MEVAHPPRRKVATGNWQYHEAQPLGGQQRDAERRGGADRVSRQDERTAVDLTAMDAAERQLAELRREDLLALVDISRELASETHLPRLLHRILERATDLTDSRDGSIILFDDQRDCLYFADAIGASAEMLLRQFGGTGGEGIPTVGSKAGQVFTSMVSEIVDAVPDDPNHYKGIDQATRRETESMVCVPLVLASRRIERARSLGVVQILNKRSGNYSLHDRVLLERFSDQAAVAIENATLVGDLFAHMGLYTTASLDPQEVLQRPAWNETVTVLFADMRAFTQLGQVIGRPETTQRMLNEFLTMLANEVIEHHGVVNKFLGDGLMAFFRGTEQSAVDAVRCAFSMLSAFDAMKAGWDAESNLSLRFLDLGIGISTEDVILGSVGSARVLDFTAIGTGVNLAAYLMEDARDGRRLLVDKVTFRAAREIIDGYDGPEEIGLRKPGQTVAHPYERFNLHRPKGSGAARSHGTTVERADAPSGSVFVSYSRHDKNWLELLRKHLSPYMHTGAVSLWDDTTIGVGDDWKDAINKALRNARVAVLLVSPDFLASDFIRRNELPPLLDAARDKGLKIIWLPIVGSSYDETPIAKLQAAFNPATPLDTMPPPQQHQCLVAVCKLIKASVR
jgi:adenylate cyclase